VLRSITTEKNVGKEQSCYESAESQQGIAISTISAQDDTSSEHSHSSLHKQEKSHSEPTICMEASPGEKTTAAWERAELTEAAFE
jgi:hypothetical protein